MKVLIVGSKGQLGTTLTLSVPEPIDCVSLYLPEFDITNKQQVLSIVEKNKPDVIINASGYTEVDLAEEDATLAYAVNADGPRNLALAARKTGSRLIHVSTDYVFDGTACIPYTPDAPCNPLCVYGKSKRAGEVNIESVLDDAVIIRTSWLYSQYGNNFVLTMLRLMREKDQLKIVADQIGSPTWASTLARGIWLILEKTNLCGIYHLSDAGVASWYDFALAIQEEAMALGILNRSIPITPIKTDQFPTSAKRPSYSVLEVAGSLTEIDITPKHWRVALREMLATLQPINRPL